MNGNNRLLDLPPPSVSASGNPEVSTDATKYVGIILAVLMFVYSVMLFLPVSNKSGVGAPGTNSKAKSVTNGRTYSIPSVIFASIYLVLSLVLAYFSLKA